MNLTKLDWTGFDWSNFQMLCIKIAESIHPDCNFDEYLEPGQMQDGIDLISFGRKDGSVFTIQCKRVEKLSTTDLDNIVQEFLDGEFRTKTSYFTLATSANLQTKKMQVAIQKHREDLLHTHHILFECWDRGNIETRLKNQWNVVAFYFGKLQANGFCYPQLHHSFLQNIESVQHYIPRKITTFRNNDPAEDIRWHFTSRTFYKLPDLFTADRLKSNHICLVGDAYQGKTSLLQQTAWELKEAGVRITPLFIEVKHYNVQPLETLLNTLYGTWTTIPLKDILLIIDGLDEVPTEKFIEMIKHINEFSKAYRPVNIVVSCRRLFYNHYDVAAKLEGFDSYELYPLDSDDIDFYLTSRLGTLYDSFKETIDKTGISGILYHPFYLVNLTEQFLLPPHKTPATKLKVVESFNDRSFDQSLTRQMRASQSVKQESYTFKKTIQRFALALQLAGTNAFKDEEMQQLFSHDERMLLQHNSLVSVSGNSWSFNNALFQEHLAASLLVQLPFEKIVEYCSVGTDIKKIKTKWIQTISSVLSLLDFNDESFQKLLQFIKDDNIELIFQTESSKYTDDFKLAVLKSLIERCVELDIRTMIVYEETIGLFIETTSSCADYLLDCISDKKITERIKIVCCRIVKNSHMSVSQQQRLLTILPAELKKTSNGNYAGYLVDILTAFKMGDQPLVEQLVAMDHLNEQHDYRNSLYCLMKTLRLVDRFYQYGITGITALINHNKNVRHGGSEINLQEFLLATEDRHHLSAVLRLGKNEKWIDYVGYGSSYKKEFSHRLFEKLTAFFRKDPLIILAIAGFIKELGKRYLRQDVKEVDIFLEETGTHWLVLRLLINDIFVDNDWELGGLITLESYDYVLFEYEEGNYDIQKLRNCFSGLRYKKKEEQANEFYELCIAATGGEIENKSESNKYLQYQEAEKQKRKNDIEYIQSSEAFKKGLLKYFEAYGEKTIPENDLYVDWESSVTRQLADSHFIYEYFLRWVRGGKKRVTLGECLKQLEKEENFEIFRAEEIMDYSYLDEDAKKVMLPILENYYLSSLPGSDFKNCMWTEGGRFIWRTKEYRLGEIFKKFRFQTPEEYLLEFIWLDNGGTRSFEVAASNNNDSISQLVLDRLTPAGLEKLKQKIAGNIKEGIKQESVLGNHLALCKKLGITDAKEDILRYIQDTKRDGIDRMDATSIYLDLGGDKAKIVALYESLNNYNDYYFQHLTSTLYKTNPDSIIRKGTEALQAADTTEERKINISQVMAEIGDIEAFKFLISLVRLNKKSPHHIQSGHPISIDTTAALQEMEDVIYLLLAKEYEDTRHFHDSARSIILEWLFALAAKSEQDLIQVITFLQGQQDKLKDRYDNIGDLNWYINRVLEDFRGSEKTVKSITETKQILSTLSA
ncbi:MAG: hypothetical protein J0L56_09080 [Chitinophagales bacterium]|nr:hypothetical protein [Chitinophagales bacterium]